MRAGAGLVTALAAGALLLSACGPTVGGRRGDRHPDDDGHDGRLVDHLDAVHDDHDGAGAQPDLHRDGGAVPDGGRSPHTS